MSAYRDAILAGTLEAEQIHADMNAASGASPSCGAVDVFRFIDGRDILLLFQKLGGLLGAFMNYQRPGILVTTERTLAIQRFTAAHELGHAVLGHDVGVDDESMLNRTPFGQGHYNAKEMAADTFAAMFLMPEFLINEIAEKQGWDYAAIRRPETIYQLSLRLGVSFEALVRTLAKHGILSAHESMATLTHSVKQLKRKLLDDTVVPTDWRCNVWELTDRDMDCSLIAEPKDYFVVRLREMSGAGYLWNFDQVIEAGFQIVSDQRRFLTPDEIGSDVERIFTAQAGYPHSASLIAEQTRPWDSSDVAAQFRIHLEVDRPAIGFTVRHRLEALAA